MAEAEDIPSVAWRRRLDAKVPLQGTPVKATLGVLVKMAPALTRIVGQMVRDRLSGRRSVVVGMPRATTPTSGVPLGGLGGGTITRGWRGDFVRWQMQPGIYRHEVVPVDQVSLWVKRESGAGGGQPKAMVLSPRPAATRRSRRTDGLESWNWALDESHTTYHALFPRAWTVYEEPAPGIRLVCRQVSPFIPGNYKESSYPAGVFVWTVENTGPGGADVALMFSFQNGDGGPNDRGGSHHNEPFEMDGTGALGTRDGGAGVLLRHVHRQKDLDGGLHEDPLTFALVARRDSGAILTRRTRFVCQASEAGRGARDGDLAGLWSDFAADGMLEEGAALPSRPGEAIGAALALKVHVPAGESRELVFALAWDMPVARFASGSAWYRRYTKFYDRDGQAAAAIARDALLGYPAWEKEIAAWQKPILDDPALPDWFKTTLFNELYYLVDGGTIWTAGEVGGTAALSRRPALPEPAIGHFAYLEGQEYLMYNTYDVHFTASFALAQLWPELELSLQRDIAAAVMVEDPEPVTFVFSGRRSPRKVRGAVPHDLGSPVEDPWRRLNAYNAQDTSRWKDLGPKFVLGVFHAWKAAGASGQAFLSEVWPAVEEVMAYNLAYDRDGDGLIENDGFPDQTYDVWAAKGPSAYSGGLWLAALSAASAMAGEMNLADQAGRYRAILERARAAYETALWNGTYYDYDASKGSHHDSVMADQMCGPWFAAACGLPLPVPEDHFRSALRRVYELNVMGWGRRRGESGAVNGMRPDGRLDRSCLQSQEVWLGTTYTLAAAMLRAGLTEEAWATAKGAYLSVYRDYGLWFQTPEGISVTGAYRAAGYMRPLAIWAMAGPIASRATGARSPWPRTCQRGLQPPVGRPPATPPASGPPPRLQTREPTA